MIPNQWYIVAESRQVRPGQLTHMTRFGEALAVWRGPDGRLACLSDRCPHRGVALHTGQLIDGCVQCPFHGFQFDPSGECRLVPANGKRATPPKAMHARSYPVREAHNFIYVWYGEPQESYPPLPWFTSLEDTQFSYSTLIDPWHTHYSHAIENQLDVVHLPFVHHNTIGRGNRTLVNGPLTEWETPDLLNLWVVNVLDQGQKPQRAAEMQKPRPNPFLQFHFPNLWQNWIANDIRIIAGFVPVDDEHTLMYLRQYQRIVKTPGLREIFNWFGTLGNLVIERQDRPVVETQRPYRSDLKIGEVLIQGDGPIIEYRRRRAELIASGAPN